MTATASSQSPHGADWGQRLEEWRDGLVNAADASTLERHVANCSECQQYLEALEHIDTSLSSSLHAPSLSADFDLGIWARIDSGQDIQRALAKQRAQEELQQQLAALKAGSRRRAALIIPGVFAGIALAFWFASLVKGSGAMAEFAAMLQQNLGSSLGQLVQTIVTGLLGGAAGLAMSQWVVPSSD